MKHEGKFLYYIKNYKKILLEILGIFLLLLIYEIIAQATNDPLFIPSLGKIFTALCEILSLKDTYLSFGESFLRTFLALIFSFVAAFLFGTVSGYFKNVRYLLNPLIGFMKLVPTPFIVYTIILFFYKDIYFGSIIITFVVIFPILYESFIAGHDNLSDSIRLSLRLEGYYKPKTFFKVILPESKPYIALGLANSIALGVKISIMSEILLGSSEIKGIGYLINIYRDTSEYDKMFALILLVLCIFVFFDLVIKILKRK